MSEDEYSQSQDEVDGANYNNPGHEDSGHDDHWMPPDPGPAGRIEDYQEALEQYQQEYYALTKDYKAQEEELATLKAREAGRRPAKGKGRGAPSNRSLRGPDAEGYFADILKIGKSFAVLYFPWHERASFTKKTNFMKQMNAQRSNSVKSLKTQLPPLLMAEGLLRTDNPTEYTRLLLHPEDDRSMKCSVFPPFLYPGLKKAKGNVLLSRAPPLAQSLREHGRKAPDPGTVGFIWGVKTVTAGAVAFTVTVMTFVIYWASMSGKEDFRPTGPTSKIEFREIFMRIQRLLMEKPDAPGIKKIYKSWNDIVFHGVTTAAAPDHPTALNHESIEDELAEELAALDLVPDEYDEYQDEDEGGNSLISAAGLEYIAGSERQEERGPARAPAPSTSLAPRIQAPTGAQASATRHAQVPNASHATAAVGPAPRMQVPTRHTQAPDASHAPAVAAGPAPRIRAPAAHQTQAPDTSHAPVAGMGSAPRIQVSAAHYSETPRASGAQAAAGSPVQAAGAQGKAVRPALRGEPAAASAPDLRRSGHAQAPVAPRAVVKPVLEAEEELSDLTDLSEADLSAPIRRPGTGGRRQVHFTKDDDYELVDADGDAYQGFDDVGGYGYNEEEQGPLHGPSKPAVSAGREPLEKPGRQLRTVAPRPSATAEVGASSHHNEVQADQHNISTTSVRGRGLGRGGSGEGTSATPVGQAAGGRAKKTKSVVQEPESTVRNISTRQTRSSKY
ncbi:hypothetical protein DFH07DRAFT_775357 [Mycena maculata]|uniref:Uncharacterized protein n=1 Tax=Mycena maculata TaxID=230809 RepID=A0AAD7ISP7_9AGAR|nr:hypothetical protein DFH07DRAFT_775357 [Mycena maculata]